MTVSELVIVLQLVISFEASTRNRMSVLSSCSHLKLHLPFPTANAVRQFPDLCQLLEIYYAYSNSFCTCRSQ